MTDIAIPTRSGGSAATLRSAPATGRGTGASMAAMMGMMMMCRRSSAAVERVRA